MEGLEQLAAVNPDVVTLDIHMPGMDGLACLDRIMIEHPRPVVMVSSLTREGADATLEALRLGAVDFVPKPEGALSLHMEVFGPLFVAKVRAAAGAKIKASLRLRERVQHRFGGSLSARPRVGAAAQAPERATGAGIVLVGTSTGGPPRWRRCSARCRHVSVAHRHRPAHAREFHRRARATPGRPLRDRRQRGRAPNGARTRPRLYRTRRRRCRHFEDRRRSGRVSAPADAGCPWHPSTDRLVESAIAHIPPSLLIGVLMTGMGDDGAGSMKRLRELGGRTIA